MRLDFEVCFLKFLGFYDVMMKTLALIKIYIYNKKKSKNHNKLSFHSVTEPLAYPSNECSRQKMRNFN
jgi:hypothetical protein